MPNMKDYMQSEDSQDTQSKGQEPVSDSDKLVELYEMLDDSQKAEVMKMVEDMCNSEQGGNAESPKSGVMITISKGK